MAITPRQEVGLQAERQAAEYLASRGLKLVLANHRSRFGELDLVMQDDATLVIVEVRQRAARDFGGAAASITASKQRRIVLATRHLLMMYPQLRRLPVRFDVVTLEPVAGVMQLQWLRAAFHA